MESAQYFIFDQVFSISKAATGSWLLKFYMALPSFPYDKA